MLLAHLAAADAAAGCAAPGQLALDVQAQAGALVARHHIVGGDVADDAVDPAVGRDGWLDIRDQANQFFHCVRLVLAALPVSVQVGVSQQLGGVDLELIRAQVIPQAGKILAVGLERGAQQVGHPVQHDLEAGRAQQGNGLVGLGDGVAAAVEGQNAVIQALGAHLHLGHAQAAQPGQLRRVDLVRAGLDHQADVAAGGSLVDLVRLDQGGRIAPIQGIEAALDEPFLVIAAVGAPGAAQDEQLDLVDRVANRLQGQPGGC